MAKKNTVSQRGFKLYIHAQARKRPNEVIDHSQGYEQCAIGEYYRSKGLVTTAFSGTDVLGNGKLYSVATNHTSAKQFCNTYQDFSTFIKSL